MRNRSGTVPASEGESVALPVAVMFAASWACWIPVATGHVPVAARGSLWLLGVFAPALSAIAFTLGRGGLPAARALLRPVAQFRVHARWYLFAVGFMAAVKVLAALLHRAALGSWPRFGHEGIVVILAAVVLSTPAQVGEELGWRGYLLPRIARRLGFARASLVVGVIWALWHLPQFFLSSADTYQQSFPLWTLEIVALLWLAAIAFLMRMPEIGVSRTPIA
ncbi:MAG TPA: CPBP family intramembrane glutamic endopeptidase [Myxococcales bacterium]|jgi:hypothetical protein